MTTKQIILRALAQSDGFVYPWHFRSIGIVKGVLRKEDTYRRMADRMVKDGEIDKGIDGKGLVQYANKSK